ncbi:hypothetical protein H6F56_20680 [Microcoleus sp. FACHB-672]|nr:hypothetical protein [Microcoleus sp. FACHB-672]
MQTSCRFAAILERILIRVPYFWIPARQIGPTSTALQSKNLRLSEVYSEPAVVS